MQRGSFAAAENRLARAKARTAASSTAGTNQPATVSAIRWIGARLRLASATMLTIRSSMVSEPIFSAFITREPVPLTVPPISLPPVSLAAGMDSPVTMDSSTALHPSRMTPSTGTPSPGRMRSLKTEHRTDVLICASAAERYVEVVAESGIKEGRFLRVGRCCRRIGRVYKGRTAGRRLRQRHQRMRGGAGDAFPAGCAETRRAARQVARAVSDRQTVTWRDSTHREED